MLSNTILPFALAGAAIAFTPPGFEPASKQNLTVAFGNTLAVNGKEIQKAETAKAPTVGTSNRLFGTYAIMMVDPDLPPSPGSTNELLHWMQAGLTSANTSTTIGSVQVFELVNTANESALASYIPPSPPNEAPHTHRYIQMLLNITGNSSALNTLKAFSSSRTNFSAANVVKSAGLTVLAGNSFNVTNNTLAQSNITILSNSTSSGSRATVTATSLKSSTTSAGSASKTLASALATAEVGRNGTNSTKTGATPKSTGGVGTGKSGGGALLAGLGVLAATLAFL